MKKPVLWAAVLAALPPGALAQEGKPATAAHQPDCTDAPRAASALPARASTRPEPQRGTVAPNTRLPPSHTVTPSSRAMAAASARAEKNTNEEKNARGHCADEATAGAPESGRTKPAGA
jgi:hypothetical protein